MTSTIKPLSMLLVALCLSLGLVLPLPDAMAAMKADLNNRNHRTTGSGERHWA